MKISHHSGMVYRCKIVALLLGIWILAMSAYPVIVEDYGFLYWEYGWRGRSPEGERVLSVATNHYGVSFDVERGNLICLGACPSSQPYTEAVSDIAALQDSLPEASLILEVISEGVSYSCIGADLTQLKGLESPSRIIEMGRYLQRFDIQNLRFESEDGRLLDTTARLEIAAWPDNLNFLLELSGKNIQTPVTLRMTLKTKEETLIQEETFDGHNPEIAPRIHLQWHPEKSVAESYTQLEVSGKQTDDIALPVSFDEQRNWYRLELPVKQFSQAKGEEHLDQYPLSLKNDRNKPAKIPLLFSLEGAFTGVIGMSAMILDAEGNQTGIPVQISKNWHRQADKPQLYEGPWFHGFTEIEVQPGKQWNGMLQLVYAWWNGKPAVSHAQLCLIGWGTNQQWDQVAIGSWGETICYDPDINLNRSMIDDIRPLMVHGMGSTAEDSKRWTWTNNVGGGDFLVYFGHTGKRQFPAHIRTAYLNSGPILTETVYSGLTQDGAIKMRITASTPSCDDIARAYHHLRYDVLKPTPFSRLAFYQLGADNYNDHQFNKLAQGDKSGLVEEWTFDKGGEEYDRKGIACEGEAPWWFSLHDALPHAPQGGAWANRGLIVRDWKAQLGGQPVDSPHASFFGTNNGIPSMNVELAPPPELKQLEPGDFVEARVELVVIPMYAKDYYGPNKKLIEHLEQYENCWQPVHRLALIK